MAYIENLDYLNVNSLRNYPIKEGCSGKDSTGFFTLPNEFIVDFSLSASSDVTKRFYISKIANLVDVITIEISDFDNVVVGNFSIPVSAHVLNNTYVLVPTDTYVKANGKLVVGYLRGLSQLPKGFFAFTSASTEFETRTVIPSQTGVNRITFINADGTKYTLTGDVNIEARINLDFKYNASSNTVILDAGQDIGLNTVCKNAPVCIQTINGIPPDSNYNFTLVTSECATLSTLPTGNGITLSDICCKPCAGCTDIEELTNRLTTVESNLIQLRNYYASLQTTFGTFQVAINTPCGC